MIRLLFNKIKHRIVTLKFSILSTFVSLFVVTLVVVIITTTLRFTNILSYTALSLMKATSYSTLKELTNQIQPAATESELTANLIANNVLLNDATQLVPYTYFLVKTVPLAQRAMWADASGGIILSEKEEDGSITSEVYKRNFNAMTRMIIHRDIQGNRMNQFYSSDLSYDTRMRNWYLKAQQEKRQIWTDVYLLKPILKLGVTIASPVFDDKGKLLGVFGIDITLDNLTRYITEQKISPHGFSFIITADENLVAFPQRNPFLYAMQHSNELVNVHKISLPLIDKSLDEYKRTHQEALMMNYDNHTYLITYLPVPEFARYGWLIGVVVPQGDFINVLKKMNLITLAISLLILSIGIILVSNLVTRIVKQVHALVKETEKIKQFDLEGELRIRSQIKEIIYLRDAIRAMKTGLRSFQKYVPKILVRSLIESGEDTRIGGVRKKLTIFFSDIENFTTIAEQVEANQLLQQLCDYFEALSRILIAENATIDKYIGDSIMAFWGAPLPTDNPCFHAARAACLCQATLQTLNTAWKTQGKPNLVTRIGIHMGDAIVGNLGSSERLNYTALGDAINIASRLEKINKVYQTHILVSETVYEQIKNQFALRMIDCVALRGKSKSYFIYELLGETVSAISFDLHAYRLEFDQGFSAYKLQQWKEAINHFEKCLIIYPNDTVAPLFIERCERFISHPPAADWNGVARSI